MCSASNNCTVYYRCCYAGVRVKCPTCHSEWWRPYGMNASCAVCHNRISLFIYFAIFLCHFQQQTGLIGSHNQVAPGLNHLSQHPQGGLPPSPQQSQPPTPPANVSSYVSITHIIILTSTTRLYLNTMYKPSLLAINSCNVCAMFVSDVQYLPIILSSRLSKV